MVGDDSFSYAKKQIGNANLRLERVEELLSDDDAELPLLEFINSPHIIHDCQICIELYLKSIFKLLGENPPRKHALDFEDAKGILRAENHPSVFDGAYRLPRVVFLNRFWREFYEDSKYGNMELNIAPGKILRVKDVERAVEDANYCKEVAEDLLEAVKEERKSESSEEDE